jgi:hypothetical protein
MRSGHAIVAARRTKQPPEMLTKRGVFEGNGSVTRADQTDCTEEDTDLRQLRLSCLDSPTDSTDRAAARVMAKGQVFASSGFC